MEELYPLLQSCPLFDGIGEESLPGMLTCLGARAIRAEKGQILFREGDATVFVGVVLTGSVQLLREDYFGNRSIVARMGPTQIFGESFAFSGARTLPVSVVADADSRILLLDSRRIITCCANACEFHNRVIFNLLRLVSGMNLLLHQKIQITSRRTTREKLMAYLLSQAKLHDSSSFRIPYDRQGLADYLEVDRSGLSAEIGKLRREGVLECEKNRFRLLCPPKEIPNGFLHPSAAANGVYFWRKE